MSDKPWRLNLAAETPADVVLCEDPRYLKPYEVHLQNGGYLLGSYKLDGIRAVRRTALVSRSLKNIRSGYAQDTFGVEAFEGLDGELVIIPSLVREGDTIYHATESAVMTHDDRTPLNWWVFDRFDMGAAPYIERLESLKEWLARGTWHENMVLLEQRPLYSLDDIYNMEREALDLNYEGLCLRRPDRPYKQNRSTFKEGGILKLARRILFEAEVLDFEEMMHNDNEAQKDARGFTKRTTHQANLRPSGMLGAYWVRHLKTGVEFKVGAGKMDHTYRKQVWENREKYRHKILRASCKPYGEKDAPRQAGWEGWRDPDDMDPPATGGT